MSLKNSFSIRLLPVLVLVGLSFYFYIEKKSGEVTQSSSFASDHGEVYVKECRGLAGEYEDCYFSYQINPKVCSAKNKCSKLVIFFSGGGMGCDENPPGGKGGYPKILKFYSDRKYVAVCAGLYLHSDTATKFALHKMAPRLNTLVKKITDSKAIQSSWNGEALLYSGVSFGATVPLVTMARSSYDSLPHWKGSQTTGGCFFDGTYDMASLDSSLHKDSSCHYLRSRFLCRRYKGTKTCRFPIEDTKDVRMDSLLGVPIKEFEGIKDIRLIECGSQSEYQQCDFEHGDWFTKDSIESLCRKYNQSLSHSCSFSSMAKHSHIKCAFKKRGVKKCHKWFETLVRENKNL